ncbi:glycosyltransferase family 39 protein [Micromonosporaceae bacterium DT194]|uniref:glycosyltransferase family 39 protein n=1 Tax=Melissospora conviva TaxID=3388432 RepID=UPI003C229D0E
MTPLARSRSAVTAWLWVLSAAAIVTSFLVRTAGRAAVRPDFDDGVYWQTAWAIGVGDRPYAEVFHAQPPLFPAIISVPFALLPGAEAGAPAETAARLVMVGFTLLIVAIAAGITALLAGARAAALTALVIAILPPVQRYCYQFGADLPATAFAGGALLAALRARATGNRWWWSAAGASMALALGAKLIAIFVGPSLLLLLLAGSLRGRGPRRALADLGAAAAGFAAACLAVVLLIRPPRAALAQIVNFHLQDTSGIRTSPTGTLTDLVLWTTPFVLAIVAATIAALRWRVPAQRTPLAAVVLWQVLVVPFGLLHSPISEHQLIFFAVPGAVLIGTGATAAWRRLRSRHRWPATAALAVLALLCAAQAWLVPLQPPIGVPAVRACLDGLPDGAVLVSDDQQLLARAGLRTPPWLADTSHVRLASGYLPDSRIITEIEAADGVLLAPPERARFDSPQVLDRVRADFPVRYAADGYQLFLRTPVDRPDCAAARVGP